MNLLTAQAGNRYPDGQGRIALRAEGVWKS